MSRPAPEPLAALARDLLAGQRRALAKAITLLESARPDQRQDAARLLTRLIPHAGRSVRLGVSGPPGVGKSTFIDVFGHRLLAAGHRIAVLAIDPSSPLSGGSILGDRVRMESLSRDPRVFIRPSPAGDTLGGTARHTREAIIACEASGYDFIVVETVGVGQSESLAASMVDVFLILHQPGSGDELQGIKRGILELADLVAVTKADGEALASARQAKGELEEALMLTRGAAQLRPPPVALVSSRDGTGLPELEAALAELVTRQKASGAFAERRRTQATAWFRAELLTQLQEALHARDDLSPLVLELERQVEAGTMPASTAAAQVVGKLLAPR